MTSRTEGRLQNKVVVVTGAGRGIGRAYAEFAAAEGASVVVNDVGADMNGDGVSEGFANEVVDGIRSRGGTAVADNHDIAADAPLVIQRAVDEFGRIDGLVNNAGIVIMAGIEQITQDQIQRMIGIHVVGTISAIQAAWPIMRGQDYGRIVNTSSASVFGVGGAPLYPTAKSAIIGLTKALATASRSTP
jgi:3-hydroxyacyl-CoA dehydrogenase/3a,7a,12a-trihydroxy-5b-cholest-24-enoyl-CoA hydratase/multifunctional beta-oxidation protein